MAYGLSRRRFLATTTTSAAIGGLAALFASVPRHAFAATPTNLTVARRTIDVLGKPAVVFGILQPDGTPGLTLNPGQRFLVELQNQSGEDAIIHWHGMTPPYAQDGVADRRRPILKAGDVGKYDFLPRTGTHWMHSHHGLQEQLLMAAPLIVRSPEDVRADSQEVVVLLHDFTFRDPAEVLADLTGGKDMSMPNMDPGSQAMALPEMDGMSMPDMDHHANGTSMENQSDAMPMDLNDIQYAAYLANDRTLADPLVVSVEKGGRVRLRLINGATSSAFHIDLGKLSGTVAAVDGNAVKPIDGNRFGMAMGQRLDLIVQLPAAGGAFPIFAQREGDIERTGLILATPGAAVTKFSSKADTIAGPIDLRLEENLIAMEPLAAKQPDISRKILLTGSMMPYVWSIDNRTFGQHRPIRVTEGQRVEIEMINRTGMAHPMHLHGHHFQVTALNGRQVQGAVRDTVLVPIGGSVTIAFDAANPGRWPFHCHNLLHMATGMMTEVVYDQFA